jgi:hypothetical protein
LTGIEEEAGVVNKGKAEDGEELEEEAKNTPGRNGFLRSMYSRHPVSK